MTDKPTVESRFTKEFETKFVEGLGLCAVFNLKREYQHLTNHRWDDKYVMDMETLAKRVKHLPARGVDVTMEERAMRAIESEKAKPGSPKA